MSTTTAPLRLNGSQMVRTVRRLARQQPDKHSPCLYVVCGVPQCIIGHALVEQIGFSAVARLDNTTFRVLRSRPGPLALRSERYGKWLDRVQAHQDDGNTWADAVAHADRLLGKVW